MAIFLKQMALFWILNPLTSKNTDNYFMVFIFSILYDVCPKNNGKGCAV